LFCGAENNMICYKASDLKEKLEKTYDCLHTNRWFLFLGGDKSYVFAILPQSILIYFNILI
jgi:hypothetical protein